MFVRFFDRAKGVAIIAGAASLLAIAGVVLLGASAAATLATWMPWPAALAVSAVGFLSVAAIAMWIGVQPKHAEKPEETDVDASAAAMAMLDLPVEVARKIIQERPIAATVVVAGIGLLIARKPQIALKMVDKLIERFGG